MLLIFCGCATDPAVDQTVQKEQSEKIRDLATGMQKSLWAVLNKIDSDSLGSELEKELKNKDIETIGVISYDPGIFTAGLKGNPVRHVQSIRKAFAQPQPYREHILCRRQIGCSGQSPCAP